MVRVISVHHFSKQDVASCPPPTSAVIAGHSTLVVATRNQSLEVRDLEAAAKLTHSFQTIDQVSTLLHSPVGNYLASLEGTPGDGNASVRVYTNWYDRRLDAAPIRPRIAGSVSPSTDQNGKTSVDMIEFPQRDPPLQITTCQSTGNLMVAAANLLIVYKYGTKVQESKTKAKYMDFQECLHVFHNFVPAEVSLCEDVIGCLSSKEVHIFKVKFSDASDAAVAADERNHRSISLYSFTSDSESASMDAFSDSQQHHRVKNIALRRQLDSETNEQRRLDGYQGSNVKLHPNHVYLDEIPRAETPPEVAEANREYLNMVSAPRIMEQILGPQSGHAVTVKYIGGGGCNLEAECVTLVSCKLLKSEEQLEAFKNLRLQPVFWSEYRVRKSKGATVMSPDGGRGQHPLQSPLHMHLMSLSACFTSQNEGYLYHLPGHLRKVGKGCGVQKIATYPFTSAVGQIALEQTLLHALTETGLETYTLRSGFHTVMEAEAINSRTNVCPGSEENPICLIGLRPFFGAKHLLVSSSYLLILAHGGVDNGRQQQEIGQLQWTLYSLRLPTSADVYEDMMQLANMNKAISPQGYYQLLCEAHILLRTGLRQLSWGQVIGGETSTVSSELVNKTKEKYRETCWLLASYHLLSEDPQEFRLSLPYFRMSARPISTILTHSKGLWQQKQAAGGSASLPGGLLHYIKEVVIRPTATENVLEANLADEIIDLLGTHSLDTLAVLILKSPGFKEFKASKMLAHFTRELAKNSRLSPEKLLAYALLSLDQGVGEEELRRGLLSSRTPGIALSTLLIDYSQLLIDDSNSDSSSFSELSVLLQTCMPELFVDVLVSLIKGGVLQLSSTLKLFLGSFVSMSNIGSEAAQNTAMLQLFLETYFVELNNREESIAVNEEEDQALQTLVRSYLTSLSVPVRFGEKDIDTDIFGTRLSYLDKLPPFQNCSKEILDYESSDFWCRNSLLKLQSLLSSPTLGLQACKNTVRQYLDMFAGSVAVGETSLRVLCSEPLVAVQILCRQHPGVLLAYAKDVTLREEHWRVVLRCLQDALTSDHDHPMHEAWYSAMQEVLDHLAQTLTLDAFLQVLPGPESNEEFQGYIQMCRKNQQAADIQALIVSTGHKLLSSLTL